MRNELQDQSPRHVDWKTEPANHGIKRQLHRGGLVAHIIGTGTNGRRYCRTVELLSEDTEELQRFDTVFALVWTLGPSVCKELVECEDLPSEAEMPLLTKA
jgi:hypothetical protein